MGAVVNDEVMVCGGRIVANYFDDCFTLDPLTNKWKVAPSMKEPRSYAASVLTNQGWWILGEYKLLKVALYVNV